MQKLKAQSIKSELAERNTALYLPSISGLRAISILMVIIVHATIHGNFKIFKISKIAFTLKTILGNGNLGVNIFFVISGFLITYLLIEEEKTQGKISLRSFYLRRILRIFPAYYFLLLFYCSEIRSDSNKFLFLAHSPYVHEVF